MGLDIIRDQSVILTSPDMKPQTEIISQQIGEAFIPSSAANLNDSSELQMHSDGYSPSNNRNVNFF